MNSCKGCEERHVGCHDKCEKYKAMKREKEVIRKKIKEEQFFAFPAVQNIIRKEKGR